MAINEAFEKWWSKEGRMYDPGSEVDWYDKRREFAEYAWRAAAHRCAEIAEDAPNIWLRGNSGERTQLHIRNGIVAEFGLGDDPA